jgi:hypothetical protein
MAVTSTTLAGVNVWQLSGNVTDAELKTAWAGLIVNNRYRPNRTIYIDNTCNLLGVRGTYHVDSENLGIILHSSRNKANTLFTNWIFIQTVGLSVGARGNFVRFTNGTTITQSITDGIDMKGGGMIYAVVGNPGGGDPRFLNEMMFGSLDGTIITSQAYTEQELQPVSYGTIWRGLNIQKCANIPIVNNGNQVVYRTNFNTEIAIANPISLYSGANGCFISTVMRKQGATFTSSLANTFGSFGTTTIMILNNWQDESYFGLAKTTIAATNWNAGNRFVGGVLKKIQVQPSTLIKTYDSRSTTVAQKSTFSETTADFLTGTNSTTADASTGRASIVCVGAIATGSGRTIVRYTGQRFTLQKFGYKVQIETPDMTFGDDDLSAFSPITMSEQTGISRSQSAINSATSITNFQELLEELHVLAIGLSGSQSYSGYNNGNLFDFTGTELKTNFTTVNVDATAASKIAYNSATNTLTIKASNLVGNEIVNSWNNSIGAINLLNGATIQGVYTTSAGTSTVLEINPPSDDYSLCVFKADGTTKYFASDVNAGSYYVYFAPNEAGTYFLAAEKYGQKRTEDTLVLNGGNVWYNITDQEDVGITDNFATASAYTTLSTTSEIYDATAVFRLTETGIKLGQLVARDGLYLDFANYNVKIKDDASAIVAVASGTITYKSIVINESLKYNAMKATPPKTITPTDVEIINVLIEDANGDSQLSILGGDNLGYELWKVTTATATDDYATGTLLTTLATNAAPYRFIGISGFDIVGRDVSSGVRRRSSMLKGTYTQAFYVGDQIQLATNAPQLIENNEKLDELILKVETNLDVAVSTRLAEIDFIAPDNDSIADILTKVDTLENTDLTGIATGTNVTDAKDEIIAELANVEVDLTGVALEATSQDILTAVNNIDVDFTPVLDAVDLTLKAADYVAPDNATIAEIQTKVDTLENTDLTGIATATDVTNAQTAIEAKIDAIPATDLTGITDDLTIINEGVKKASLFIPHTQNL